MNSRSYWAKFTDRRLNRRRLLMGTGYVGLGAAALVALGCSGDDDEPSTPQGSSSDGDGSETPGSTSRISTPEDTTGQAVRGGVLKDYANGDYDNFDVLLTNTSGTSFNSYSRLFYFKMGKYPEPADGSSTGLLAEDYELSGDRLTLTIKLRPGLKWDSREPTNGRVIDSEDVLFSWRKFIELHPGAVDLAAERQGGGSVESISAPDDRTIVMKLARPDPSVITYLTAWDHFYPMPRESESQFNPQTTPRGYSAWTLDEHVPASRLVWKRNPEFHEETWPYIDTWEEPIIPDYTQRLAQFRTGAVYTNVASIQDIIPLYKDAPQTRVTEGGPQTWGATTSFGYEDDSPFGDVRMRRAVGLMIDRETYANVIEDRERFESEGFPLTLAWNTVVPAGWPGFWLDPDGADFGPSAKYLHYDPAESKKLLDAAGYDGREIPFIPHPAAHEQYPPHLQIVELMHAMLTQGGLNLRTVTMTYADYRPNILFGYNRFQNGPGYNGIQQRSGRGYTSLSAYLHGLYHKDGLLFHGLSPDGNNAWDGDPQLNDMIDNIRVEFDVGTQQDLTHEFIRYFTDQAYAIIRPSNSRPLEVTWPALSNVGTYRGWANLTQEEHWTWWIDETKPPFV